MNSKQWTLLIIMSTVLILSTVMIIMLLLSDENVTESEPPQSEQKVPETEDFLNEDPDGNDSPEKSPDGEGENSPPADSSSTVNEWFEQEPESQTEQKNDSDDQIDKNRTGENSEINSELQMPEAPEEPDIHFEDLD
ncbi:hypothetical protein [Jeotgalibacillus malaysiensis]|uniref:hypothetical protein n=1 Tax=Jeotgalibacillus malaysiensis TaxID=1508404 RepID=UPI00384BF0C8